MGHVCYFGLLCTIIKCSTVATICTVACCTVMYCTLLLVALLFVFLLQQWNWNIVQVVVIYSHRLLGSFLSSLFKHLPTCTFNKFYHGQLKKKLVYVIKALCAWQISLNTDYILHVGISIVYGDCWMHCVS